LFALDVRDLQSFGDTSKVGLFGSLRFGSERIPWVVARDRS